MKVKMLQTRLGSPDGISVFSYPKGELCDLSDRLAQVFIAEGWAKPADGRSKGNRKKDNSAAPENKARHKKEE